MLHKIVTLALTFSLFLGLTGSNHVEAEKTWRLGEGLVAGDSFIYKICDPLLSIKTKIKETCYTAKLEFKQSTKYSNGKSWVVETAIEHGNRVINSTMQISALTFQVRSDYTSMPYAMSIQRTLLYMNNYANIVAEKPLKIGAVWGDVAAYGAYGTEITVRQLKTIEISGFEVQTYKLGYEIMKESTLYIVDNFPFPIRAKMYEPTLAYSSPPLKFELELVTVTTNAQ